MRWLGLVLVVGSAALIGHLLAREKERRVGELGALLHSLERLETEVVYGLTYLQEAFERIAADCPECRPLFGAAAAALAQGAPARRAWRAGLASFGRQGGVTPADLRPLERIGPVLGLTSAEDQRRHLRLVRREVELRLAEAREQLPQTARLCRALGVCGGVAVALLLL